jgi:hypothetical protein
MRPAGGERRRATVPARSRVRARGARTSPVPGRVPAASNGMRQFGAPERSVGARVAPDGAAPAFHPSAQRTRAGDPGSCGLPRRPVHRSPRRKVGRRWKPWRRRAEPTAVTSALRASTAPAARASGRPASRSATFGRHGAKGGGERRFWAPASESAWGWGPARLIKVGLSVLRLGSGRMVSLSNHPATGPARTERSDSENHATVIATPLACAAGRALAPMQRNVARARMHGENTDSLRYGTSGPYDSTPPRSCA